MVQALLEEVQQDTTVDVGSEVILADEGGTLGTSLSFSGTTLTTFSFMVPDVMPAENMETENQNYETTLTSSLSSTNLDAMPAENIETE